MTADALHYRDPECERCKDDRDPLQHWVHLQQQGEGSDDDMAAKLSEQWAAAEAAVSAQAAQQASVGRPVATLNTPISINGLKRALKQLKERHGSKVQVVPHEWGLEFVLHETGVVPK